MFIRTKISIRVKKCRFEEILEEIEERTKVPSTGITLNYAILVWRYASIEISELARQSSGQALQYSHARIVDYFEGLAGGSPAVVYNRGGCPLCGT